MQVDELNHELQDKVQELRATASARLQLEKSHAEAAARASAAEQTAAMRGQEIETLRQRMETLLSAKHSELVQVRLHAAAHRPPLPPFCLTLRPWASA